MTRHFHNVHIKLAELKQSPAKNEETDEGLEQSIWVWNNGFWYKQMVVWFSYYKTLKCKTSVPLFKYETTQTMGITRASKKYIWFIKQRLPYWG
jgi:hypothetical protein